ncbi:hypothetical protein PVK06_008817 [Gossypium arboreum]|uniref:DUF7745 domain-containing protein n=1 Tax=Gossypium arboreum TaxID=29729 RepID=A0ABR0QM10_GOSAR|nr:hypothetical protein PVK06_008817 [Gossypium arboreum]
MDLFALAIYGLIVFPKVLGHIEVAVVDFFERLKQGINPVLTILAETFRSLSCCRRKEEGRFIRCAQLLNNLRTEDITWRAPWIHPSVLLYKCGSQDWVPLLGLWGGIRYALLMVQRQFASRQFIPATRGLTQLEFAFMGEGYMKRVQDTAKSWKEIHLMELALYADTITQDYDLWRK